jgi:hypothetical protein
VIPTTKEPTPTQLGAGLTTTTTVNSTWGRAFALARAEVARRRRAGQSIRNPEAFAKAIAGDFVEAASRALGEHMSPADYCRAEGHAFAELDGIRLCRRCRFEVAA